MLYCFQLEAIDNPSEVYIGTSLMSGGGVHASISVICLNLVRECGTIAVCLLLFKTFSPHPFGHVNFLPLLDSSPLSTAPV